MRGSSMLHGKHFLFVPGPSNVPDRILRAMDRPMIDPRSSAFPELTTSLLSDLKQLFRTDQGQCFIFPSSGTGAWEAALSNTLSPGDRVLAPRFGMFSHLWVQLAEQLGFHVDVLDEPWGDGAPTERIAEVLHQDNNHTIKAVLLVHNETSTGVTTSVAGVRDALNEQDHPAMLFVDGVSSIGSLEFAMDEWGVDVAVTGTQKGLMLPPGLGLLGVSQRAMTAAASATSPRAYFRFDTMAESNAAGYFPYTPSLSLLFGLQESLTMLLHEGLERVRERHARMAEGVRRAVKAWGLPLCARSEVLYSDTVSAIRVPGGFDARTVIDLAFRRYNLSLGAGLGELAGEVFRIGHMGDINELMVSGAIAGSEMAMRDVGIQISAGSGVAAAMEYYRTTSPAT
ncbi:MAG: aminotransferase class V-fold PLP-dependent enzyme [Gemmatimonadetes bacterium]|nr:aminotransferase class V-fold PLP-dependent enzyme [Gemmatimonadota bacterium]